jgi:sulfide:quinone oxidoreductase
LEQDYLQIRVLELAPQVYVSGQLFETDLKLLARQGVRTIISSRPDNETPGQPTSAELARVAEEFGITFVHFPIEPGKPTEEEVAAFAKVCEDLERPMHVFSRNGVRAIRLWESAEAL